MKQQRKISIYLKCIVGFMMLVTAGITAFLTVAAISVRSNAESSLWQFIIFTYIYAICCMAILVDFYKVCTRIGVGDSFSTENAHSFQLMERTSYIASVAAAVRIVWCFMARIPQAVPQTASNLKLTPMTGFLAISIAEFLAFLIFGLVCKALSALIVNAAEIKAENELTI